jgi:hypothetical protein
MFKDDKVMDTQSLERMGMEGAERMGTEGAERMGTEGADKERMGMEGADKERMEGIDAIWSQVIEPMEAGFLEYRDLNIDKWNDKVQPSKKFKVINSSITAQIRNSMSDLPRLTKRTKLMRTQYDIIGHVEPIIETVDNDEHLKKYNDNIFDDCDYYQHLLKVF